MKASELSKILKDHLHDTNVSRVKVEIIGEKTIIEVIKYERTNPINNPGLGNIGRTAPYIPTRQIEPGIGLSSAVACNSEGIKMYNEGDKLYIKNGELTKE